MESKESTMCPQCVEVVAKAEKTIREHPDQAILGSVGVGLVLAQLPLRVIMSAVARLILLVLKPAVVLYGIFRLVEDRYGQPGPDAEH